jgi:ribosomal protein L32
VSLVPEPTTGANIDDRIDAWHEGDGEGLDLATYLGWTWAQYAAWVEHDQFPVLAKPECSSCGRDLLPERGTVCPYCSTATKPEEAS